MSTNSTTKKSGKNSFIRRDRILVDTDEQDTYTNQKLIEKTNHVYSVIEKCKKINTFILMKPILIKSQQQIHNIKTAGMFLEELLILIANHANPGVSLLELEEIAEQFINKHNLKGAFKGYQGYPANLCLSVNDCLVHGIPDKTILKAGDLLKIDAGVVYQRGIADSAISICVGGEKNNPKAQDLINITHDALEQGIQIIKPGISLWEYGKIVSESVIGAGARIIKPLTGHGVGEHVHEGPYVYNYPEPQAKKIFFKKGMVLALEPITARISTDFVEKKGNHRNLYTVKGDLGAQREYTVVVTDNGIDILAGVRSL